jgi:hypothetical protein
MHTGVTTLEVVTDEGPQDTLRIRYGVTRL